MSSYKKNMRTPTLQYLYLQKPVTMVIIICIISVLPWIGLGDFSTKGEPREASVAISMLEQAIGYYPRFMPTNLPISRRWHTG